MSLTNEQMIAMYTNMTKIRMFEERVAEYFAEGKIPGFVHLYIGEEAVATGVCASLRDTDYITSTHRGHGHCISKGAELKYMMAETVVYSREFLFIKEMSYFFQYCNRI